MQWYEADEWWYALYKINQDQYLESYVVEGFFHRDVLTDVKDAFVGVSYLMAAAYHHHPLMDDAMNKMLLTLEMAVKLKAKQLEIDLKAKRKNGKTYSKTLDTLITKVCEKPALKFLKDDLNRARTLRNMKMHPDRHSVFTAIGHTPQNAKLFINVINLLFLPNDTLRQLHDKIDSLDKQLDSYKTGLFTLAYENTKILIDGVHTFKYRAYQDRQLLVLYIAPISTAIKELYIDKKYPDPLLITLQDFEINEHTITGTDTNGSPVVIEHTEKEENLVTWTNYHNDLNAISEQDIGAYISIDSNRALFKMEQIIYEQLWKPVSKVS